MSPDFATGVLVGLLLAVLIDLVSIPLSLRVADALTALRRGR